MSKFITNLFFVNRVMCAFVFSVRLPSAKIEVTSSNSESNKQQRQRKNRGKTIRKNAFNDSRRAMHARTNKHTLGRKNVALKMPTHTKYKTPKAHFQIDSLPVNKLHKKRQRNFIPSFWIFLALSWKTQPTQKSPQKVS